MRFFTKDKQDKVIIVHLGNIGLDDAAKTRQYAKRFQNFRFYGIDLAKLTGQIPSNWEQIKTNFLNGLSIFQDDSIDIVSSELGLGYYNANGEISDPFFNKIELEKIEKYTKNVVECIFKKLKKGGKLLIVVGRGEHRDYVLNSLNIFHFRILEMRKLRENELERTGYIKHFEEMYHNNPDLFSKFDLSPPNLIQIVAEKV